MQILYSKHRVDSKTIYVRLLRHYLREFCLAGEIDTSTTDNISLAFNEAMANVIEHAYNNDQQSPIIVEFIIEEVEQNQALANFDAAETEEVAEGIILQKRFIVKIRDFGKKVKRSEIVSRALNNFQAHGLGVYIIEKSMDAVFYDISVDRGTLLTMIKLLD